MRTRGFAITLMASASTAAVAAPVAEREAASPVSVVSREALETLPATRSVEDLLRTCPARTIPTAPRQPRPEDRGLPQAGASCVQPDDLRMIDIYRLHNDARRQVGSKPLVWDPVLAAQAQSYGPELAQYGRPVHSSRVGRETSRENLLQALPGTSPSAMMGVWTGERKYFINGKFPDVSTTGNWADVGHYTQLVWPTTTNLGCAIHSGGQFDWLICRYSPPGNKDGKMVLADPPKPQPSFDDYTRISDHKPVKADYVEAPQARPRSSPGSCSPAYMAAFDARIRWLEDAAKTPAASSPVPPPESILDDLDQPLGPPPESILDDVDAPAEPPPESILDDVGDSARPREAPLPRSEKGKAVHDTPMAQPIGPATSPAAPTEPRPTAADPAPGGQEARHPLVVHFGQAWSRHDRAICGGDADSVRQAAGDMDHDLDELRKRLKAAEQAGSFSSVNPDELKRIISLLEGLKRAADARKLSDGDPGAE